MSEFLENKVHFNYNSSIKKGRFSIGNAKTENFTEKFGSCRRGRFTINYTGEIESKILFENRILIDLIKEQQRQIEMLFDVIKNTKDQNFCNEFCEYRENIVKKLGEIESEL